MTAQLETYGAHIAPEGVSGDLAAVTRAKMGAKPTLGTLWERVEESGANLVTVNGWLALDTGQHNCAGGFAAVGYAHERGCGLEPLYQFDKEGTR